MTIEERINEVRIKLNNPSTQSYGLLKQLWAVGYLEGYKIGIADAKEGVASWITAEKVRDLWEEQR